MPSLSLRFAEHLAFATLITIVVPLPASAQLVANMYDTARVAREKPRLESRVNEIYVKAFSRALTAVEARALSGMSVQVPLDGDPVIGYQSHSGRRVITMPAVSLLFFEDLCVAYAWLQVHGYRLETIEEYLTMLKYKTLRAFGGRYPPPLEALGIPADAAHDARVDHLSLRLRNTGYAFILGHELGHIRYRHLATGNPADSQANERQADQFGLDLMRRTATIPMGAMIFFQAAAFYFENRADFASDAEWHAHLTKTQTHPLSTDRLLALSSAVTASAEGFARGQPNRAAAIETIRGIADGFAEFAAFLDNPLLQRAMRDRALRANVKALLPRRH